MTPLSMPYHADFFFATQTTSIDVGSAPGPLREIAGKKRLVLNSPVQYGFNILTFIVFSGRKTNGKKLQVNDNPVIVSVRNTLYSVFTHMLILIVVL